MSEIIIKMTGGVIRQQKNTILKNINLEIKSGEFIYLIGKVGSGKSSFLKTLYAELPLDYGSAEVVGFQLKKLKKSQIPLLRRKCGIVFQDFKLLIDRNVHDNLKFVLQATGWKNKKAIEERIDNVLTKVDMLSHKMKMPHQLSGGEQQRIVLARALLNVPPLIIADEPTGNIDPETSYRLIELLRDICDAGKTIIIATHQYDLIKKFPGRVLCCENGEIVEISSPSACDCSDAKVEVVVENSETVEENIDVVEISETSKENIDVVENIELVEESHKEEESHMEEESPEVVESIKVVENIEPVMEVDTDTEQTADIDSLLGKLEIHEITTFDYEIEALPETDKKEENITPKPTSPIMNLDLMD